MRLEARFEGGLAVSTTLRGQTVRTDQPAAAGGAGAAPSPFDLFLASLVTCAGYYALQFCRQRGIDTEGLGVAMEVEKDPESGRLSGLVFEIAPPPGFPGKYRDALLRAVDQCAVKKVLAAPPATRARLAEPASHRAA